MSLKKKKSENDNSSREEKKVNYGFIFLSLLVSILLIAFFLNQNNFNEKLPPQFQDFSSGFLLIFILLVAFFALFDWVGKPMSKDYAGLGSILQLQTAYSQKQIVSLFNIWGIKLQRKWLSEEDEAYLDKLPLSTEIDEVGKQKILAWINFRQILRKSIWRDNIGFIPMYSIIFGTILYFGSFFISDASNAKIGIFPCWLCLIIATAFFDYLENIIHLYHIKNYSVGKESIGLVRLGVVCTFLKFIGFITATILSIITILKVSFLISIYGTGWKWILTLVLFYGFFISLLAKIGQYIYSQNLSNSDK